MTFGTGTAISNFGKDIVFTQPYSGGTIKSASILIMTPDQTGPTVFAISSVGTTSLIFDLNTSGGGPFPFSPVVANFEVVLSDGTTQDGPAIHVTYADTRFTWKTKLGSVVRLHYIDATDSFAQQMVSLADSGVTKAAAMFGVSETKPIDYYVYPNQSDFQEALSEPGTIGGLSMPAFRTCYAIVSSGDSGYAADVMPHEVTHVVFADATQNRYHNPPRWLNEGFADYLSIGYDSGSRQLVTEAAHAGTLPSLVALTDYFPLDADRIYLAYAESVGAVDFMVGKYGQPAVLKLVGAYAKGDSDDEAFKAALGVDVAAFDAAWLAQNGVTRTKYGPQPAPTGPIPSDWNASSSGSSATPGPTGAGSPNASASTSGDGEQSSGSTSNSTAVLLAALLAGVGLVLIGIALVLTLNSRRAWR